MSSRYSTSEVAGYFGPESVTWLLYREPVFVFGAVRALLLQVAHPAVADGVARYSNFQADPFGRGYRTFAAMAMIYFGTKKQADATAQRLWRIHSGINGHYKTSPDAEKPPQAYNANNPDLLLWVLATLIDTSIEVYSRTLPGRLPAGWQEQFYEESKTAARVLGIPESAFPADLQAFNRWFQGVLHAPWLGAAPACRDMAQAIVCHPRAPKRWAALFAAGWLPRGLCQNLGIDAGADPEMRLEKWLRRFGRLFLLLPGGLRYNPAWHQAMYRIARANGTSPSLGGRFFTWASRYVKVPLGLELTQPPAP